MSSEDTFDVVVFPPLRPPSLTLDANDIKKPRRPPLTEQEFYKLFDRDGRLIDEHKLRQEIFRGGVDPGIRKQVWQFLFGLYPFLSTAREREVLLADKFCKYKALKKRWKSLLAQEEESKKLLYPGYLDDEKMRDDGEVASAMASMADEDIPVNIPKPNIPSPDVRQQLTLLSFESQLYAGRRPFDMASCKTAIRIIDKDVPRTDREVDYFKGAGNPHLQMLRNILITYAAFNPDVSYTQGMNDMLSRFLVVFDHEVEAYWCFVNYIDQMKADLVENGILNKLNIVRDLLSEVDQDLYGYLDQMGIGDMTVCHRWMLLLFKREFSWEDGLRCFEMLSSHHLEVSSMEAEKIRYKERKHDFQTIGGKNRLEDVPVNTDFTFDIFMCVTILIEQRENIFRCTDAADVVQLICGLTMHLNLNDLLAKSEAMFERYCRKSVVDCFHMLDYPSPVRETSAQENQNSS